MTNLKLSQKAVHKARRIENNLAHKEEIEKHINNRFNNFAQNTSKMIDSILNRHQDPVVFYNIKTEDTTVTEPKQIKEEVRKHYEKWTQANPLNPRKWSEWATKPNLAYMYNNAIWEKKEWITLKEHQAGFIDRISSLKKDNTALINHWTLSHITQTLQPCLGCWYNNSVLAKEKCTKKISLDLLQSIPVDSKKRLRIQISDLR
ncbi:22051_t:CDS:2 [Gigaspora margarita]|uniref:22051_t:CDS:1 n=1 Tax=Gigaspora margarita TaxID=4874 RepID=A0ABN7VGV6_GIGMA|nr:22051_t:CDS:2 [Gigaspora margarita]